MRRIAVAAGVAVGVAWVGSRVNPPEDRTTLESGIGSCLLERAANVTIDTRSLEDAVNSLRTGFKTRIDLRSTNSEAMDEVLRNSRESGVRGSSSGSLRLKNVTLGQAVAAVIRQFEAEPYYLSYIVERGTVRIGLETDIEASEPVMTRAYDVTEWFTTGPTAHQYHEAFLGGHLELTPESIKHIVMETLRPPIWAENGGIAGTGVTMWGNYLIVRAPVSVQRDVQRGIFLMRHPIRPGAGREPMVTQ